MPSFSAMDRVMACPASEVLPQADTLDESYMAGRGHHIHGFLHALSAAGRDVALEHLATLRGQALSEGRLEDEAVLAEAEEYCTALDPSRLPVGAQYTPEISFAYDWEADTAREIDRATDGRNYGTLKDTEIPGRLDVGSIVMLDGERWAGVHDYKTGFRRLGAADKSWQLRMGALALARLHACVGALPSFVRMRQDGTPVFISGRLDGMDLDAIAEQVKARMLLIRELRAAPPPRWERPHIAKGKHCTYCPAWERCPLHGQVLAAMTGIAEGELDGLPEDVVREAYLGMRHMKAVLPRLETKFKTYARRNPDKPIRVDDETVYGPKEVVKEDFNVTKSSVVIAEHFDAELGEGIIKTESEVTKASIDRALRVWMHKHPGNRITDLNRAALKLLREKGAVTVTRDVEVKEHIPKDEEPK